MSRIPKLYARNLVTFKDDPSKRSEVQEVNLGEEKAVLSSDDPSGRAVHRSDLKLLDRDWNIGSLVRN